MRLLLGSLLLICSSLNFAATKPPQLIVQIVVDQLRGDLITIHQKQFDKEGFNYLIAHGLDYHNAHHPHANTVTCVGHATIATGTYPSFHGIVANDWYDRKTGLTPYCVADPKSPILGTVRSQKKLAGRSPHYLLSSTFSDELVLANKGRSFAVSFKDRGAITLAGQAGKAFWFDKLNGGFVTSQFYYSNYPQWVNAWNKQYKDEERLWTPSHPLEFYLFRKAPRFTNRYLSFGSDFNHNTGKPDSINYYKFLSMTPFADELTADFAISLLNHEKLGKNPEKTDYLALSFSAVDAIGHQFGPYSLESEDNLLRLDKTLARLFTTIDKQIGLENTLIILTADHGISDSPTYLAAHNIKENQSLDFLTLKKLIEDALAQRYRLPAKSLEAIMPPFIYLNHQTLDEYKLSLNEVSNYLAKLLNQQDGIFKVYTLPVSSTERDWIGKKVAKMVSPLRSGDLYIVPLPNEALDNKNTQRVAHGTPWQYDSYVPLLFANPTFKPQRLFKPVSITDLAPTLAAILSIKQPSAALGKPLEELLLQYF